MNHPSIAGWLNILGVGLNAAGVLTLFYFRDLSIVGAMVSDGLVAKIRALNLARVSKQRVGAALIGLGWLAQVIAQCFP
jgi:hypothetical protein